MVRKPVPLLLLIALITPILVACAGAAPSTPAATAPTAVTRPDPTAPAAETKAAPATAAAAPTAFSKPAPASTAAPSSAPQTAWTGKINWYQFGYTRGGQTAASKMTDQAVAAFEKANPGIKINVVGVPFEGGQQKLDTALAAGGNDAPDVFRIASDRLVKYATDGLAAPIDEYLTAEDRADIYPNVLAGVEWKGKHYAWPLWVPPMGMYLNPAIFKERNVSLPSDNWTYDEFARIATQLTFKRANGTQVYGFSAAIQPDIINVWPFLYGDGGRILGPEGEYAFDRPEAVAGLEKLVDLVQGHKVTPPDFGNQKMADVVAAFKDEKSLAMYLAPTADVATYGQEKVSFEVRFVPVGASGKHITVGGLGTFAVRPQQDQGRLAAAMKLARFLTSKEIADAVPGYYLAPAARKSVTVPASDPAMQKFAQMVAFTKLMPQTPVWGQISAKVNAQIQAAVAGVVSAEEALKRAGAEIRPLLK